LYWQQGKLDSPSLAVTAAVIAEAAELNLHVGKTPNHGIRRR
jgi:hypothetical protein